MQAIRSRSAILTLVLCVAAGCGGAMADDLRWGDGFDVLIDQPGVEVTVAKNPDGIETRRFEMPGDVSMLQRREADAVTMMTMDASGLGAVRCAWEIFVGMHDAIALCEGADVSGAQARLDRALTRVESFMVTNGYGLITADQVAQARRRKFEEASTSSDFAAFRGGSCIEPVREALEGFRITDAAAFEEAVDRLLSVPRFPVIAPCL